MATLLRKEMCRVAKFKDQRSWIHGWVNGGRDRWRDVLFGEERKWKDTGLGGGRKG